MAVAHNGVAALLLVTLVMINFALFASHIPQIDVRFRPVQPSLPSRLQQFYQLTKPRVVSLIVFTAVIGMFLAVPGHGAAAGVSWRAARSASRWSRARPRR